jgi:hypothetical protein
MSLPDWKMSADLSQRLCGFVDQSFIVPFIEKIDAQWIPYPNRCHENARHWIADHSGYQIVYGWLHVYGNVADGATFDAHSVVLDASGKLWDVTLENPASIFILHPDGVSEFLHIVQTLQLSRVSHAPDVPFTPPAC